MRIISKFNDYYDCIQKEGQDQSIIFVREQSCHKHQWPFYNSWYERGIRGFDFFPMMIGFCGKIYPCIKLKNYGHTHLGVGSSFICYSIEDVDKVVELVNNKEITKDYNDNRSRMWRRKSSSRNWFKGRFLLGEYEAWLSKIFADYDCFIFLLKKHGKYNEDTREYDGNLIINPLLRELEFMRIVDPYTAFQEVQMAVNNLAEPRKVMPVFDDKTMAEIKGFDRVTSFRRPKSDKKKRRKDRKNS